MTIEVVHELGSSTPRSEEFLSRLQRLCTEFNVLLVGSEQHLRPSRHAIHVIHQDGAYEFLMVHPRPQEDSDDA